MRELAALQGGIDQIVAKNISGDDQGHHICRPGRQKAYPIEAPTSILFNGLLQQNLPEADKRIAVNQRLFDHLVGSNEHRCWNCKAEHLRRFCVDD